MTESKKILVIQQNQEFAKSHFSFTINLVYILAEAGHEVHLLVPLLKDEERLSDAKMERKFKVIYFQASEELRKAEKEFNKYGPQNPKMANGSGGGPSPGANAPRGHPGRRPTAVFAKLYLEMASDLDLMGQLRAERFDIGMAEAFMTNEWSLAVFRLLVIPRIVVTTAMAALPEFYYYLGLLGRIRRAQVPALRGTQIGDRSEAQRRERADQMWQDFTDAISKHLTDSIEINVAFQEIADRLYGRGRFPLMSELFRNCDTYLVNTQPELDFDASAQAILNAPGSSLRFVGGVNAARARQQQNGHSRIGQAILDKLSSKRALVLFSLGTVMDTAKRMTEQQFEAILQSMGRFPDFLFVFRLSEGDHRIGEPSRRGMDNVLATDWVDQPAILADPRTVAFISHCGMNSVLEAAWNGVPLVCLPCMGDQFYNSEALASKGAALVVDFFSPEFSADILSRALAQVLGQPVNGTMGVHIQQQQQQSNFDPSQVRKLAEALRRKGLIADVLNAVIG